MVTRRCVSWNVLTDHYLGYGDYSHAPQHLLVPGARLPLVLGVVDALSPDIIGIQEADIDLVTAFDATGKWQTFWASKGKRKPDGCLTLVRRGIRTSGGWSRLYSDGTGHVAQSITVGGVDFVNTHIKWPPSIHGSAQAAELLQWLDPQRPVVVMTDCNDLPYGPVRRRFETAGFVNTCGTMSTAFVNGELMALDLLAVRGAHAEQVQTLFDPTNIPNGACPSDHIPVVAQVETS